MSRTKAPSAPGTMPLAAVHRKTPIAPLLESQIEPLCERGVLERCGEGLMLSRGILDLTVSNGLNRPPDKPRPEGGWQGQG
ncbi:MAG: hypothetical protein GY835_03525 [bacterium]|nr:hypothetical protein [bacterium]